MREATNNTPDPIKELWAAIIEKLEAVANADRYVCTLEGIPREHIPEVVRRLNEGLLKAEAGAVEGTVEVSWAHLVKAA